jgi:hypothetical protein
MPNFPEEMVERLADDDGLDTQMFVGLDDAFVGLATIWSPLASGGAQRLDVAVYDGSKIVQKLVAEGMDKDDALEYIDFNVTGAYVGPATPVVFWPCRVSEVQGADQDADASPPLDANGKGD